MIDWAQFLLNNIGNIISGFIGFVLGMWYFNRFILPKIYAKMGVDLISNMREDAKIKPIITRFSKMAEQLEPVVEKLKTVDFAKMQEDLKPLMETLKKIDPEAVEDLLNSLRKWTNTITEKPKIPEPD